MTNWQRLSVDGPVGTSPVAARLVEDPATEVVLVRTRDGAVHATAAACPHLGQSLTRASVDGDVIECGHHHYRYRLGDGVCVGPGGPGGQLAGRLTVHEVRERDDGFEIRLATGASDAWHVWDAWDAWGDG